MQTWAEQMFEKLSKKMRATAPRAAEQGVIPYQGVRGEWLCAPFEGDAWWTNGFWPALMWQMYAATGDEWYMGEARRVQSRLLEVLHEHVRLNHDVGFMYLLSFGADHRLTGDESAARVTGIAADVLAGRFNPNGFIRAWDGAGREGWAIVDCLMNLPLLHWASARSGDPRYRLIADIHADTSIEHFVREDGSCNHIVIFDPQIGAALDAPGGQGYAPGSSWSRGQAWALYGFTLAHQNTGEPRYLGAARKVADYFIGNIRPDGLTDCDFRQPKGEERIDNIAGACAASGLLLLAKLAGEPRYREAALRMLRALDGLCSDWTDERMGILTHCTASYHDDGAGRHVNLMYGDYFFVEAIARLRGTDPMLWSLPPRERQRDS